MEKISDEIIALIESKTLLGDSDVLRLHPDGSCVKRPQSIVDLCEICQKSNFVVPRRFATTKSQILIVSYPVIDMS